MKCWINTCDIMENREKFEIHLGKQSIDTDTVCKGALPLPSSFNIVVWLDQETRNPALILPPIGHIFLDILRFCSVKGDEFYPFQ